MAGLTLPRQARNAGGKLWANLPNRTKAREASDIIQNRITAGKHVAPPGLMFVFAFTHSLRCGL